MLSPFLASMPAPWRGQLFAQVRQCLLSRRHEDAKQLLLDAGVEPGYVAPYIRSAALITTTFATLEHAHLWNGRNQGPPRQREVPPVKLRLFTNAGFIPFIASDDPNNNN